MTVDFLLAIARRAFRFIAAFGIGALVGVSATASADGVVASPAAEKWAGGLNNLSADEGLTLLLIAKDLYPDVQKPETAFMACIDPFDKAAADPKSHAAFEDAMSMVLGASRRMGYAGYTAITDEYERPRMAKMLADGRWMREFKNDVGNCLGAK